MRDEQRYLTDPHYKSGWDEGDAIARRFQRSLLWIAGVFVLSMGAICIMLAVK